MSNSYTKHCYSSKDANKWARYSSFVAYNMKIRIGVPCYLGAMTCQIYPPPPKCRTQSLLRLACTGYNSLCALFSSVLGPFILITVIVKVALSTILIYVNRKFRIFVKTIEFALSSN